MPKYLLRAEAVNLNNFVNDTNRIQSIRGGSNLLLESMHGLHTKDFSENVKLTPIATGASIGLYSFNANSDEDADEVVMTAHKHLSQAVGGHATFVVNFEKDDGKFLENLAMITARNRWQQYQQPTLILPEIGKGVTEPCSFDGLRPASIRNDAVFRGDKLSDSVYYRVRQGRELRQNLYKLLLDTSGDEFTNDLSEIAEDCNHGNLNGKIACIYLDGNWFTKIRNKACTTRETLENFSKYVEVQRRNFLEELLTLARSDSNFKTENGAIRLETLLWGGDELEIIVPAWKGWQVIRLIQKTLGKMEFNGYQLSHAGGIIYCNHKAPIIQVRRMVRQLAEMAKESIPAKTLDEITHNTCDLIYPFVLESFDTIGTNLKSFFRSYHGQQNLDHFCLDPQFAACLEEVVQVMKSNGFPRNKIFDIVQAVRDKKSPEVVRNKALSGLDDERRNAIEAALNTYLDNNDQRWLLVAEMWDYVGRAV